MIIHQRKYFDTNLENFVVNKNDNKNVKENLIMGKYNYSNEIANIIKQFLTDDKWRYSFDEECGLFDFGVKMDGKIQRIRYLVDVKECEVIFYGICPIGVDYTDARTVAQMAEFICRVNVGLKNGCFEFDIRDGEIRYKSYIDCEERFPSNTVIQNSIHCIARMYERYADGITDIIFAGSSAKEAIDMCQKSTKEELRELLVDMGVTEDDMPDVITYFEERLGITSEEEAESGEDTTSESAEEIHVDTLEKKKTGRCND